MRAPVKKPSLPATKPRHSVANALHTAAARDTCGDEQPNVMHLPKRAHRSECQRAGGAGGGWRSDESDASVKEGDVVKKRDAFRLPCSGDPYRLACGIERQPAMRSCSRGCIFATIFEPP
jgi:hypothetical protein